MTTRNKYLTRKAFNIYLGASILTALSSMLGNIVDSIIVSNLIAPDAMSAVSLSRPLIQLYYTIYLLLGLGGSLLVAFSLGKSEKEEANRTFTVVVGALGVFSLLITAVGVWRPEWVVGLFCSEAEVKGYALEYFSPVLWGCVLYMGSFFLGTYTTIDGAPRLVSAAMIADNVCNLLFDLLLIKVCGMGTAGSAIASNIGHALGIAVMAYHYRGGRSAYRLVAVTWAEVRRRLGKIARSGAPFAVASICLTLYMYSANIIIQDSFGASGIYIFSVMLSLLTFYNFFLSGACSTLQSLGALLVGLGDMVGLRLSVGAAFRFLVGSLAVCCGVLWVAPQRVCSLFGCPPELLEECCYACRIYAVAFVFFCLIYLLMVTYKLVKQEALANFLSFALSLTVIPVIWAIARWWPQAIWWSNLVAYALVAATVVVLSALKRKEGMLPLTLLPAKEAVPTLDFSVEYSLKGLSEGLERVSRFMEEQGVDQQRRTAMELSAEELLKNIIDYAHTSKGAKAPSKSPRKAYIDVRMSVPAAGEDGDPRVRMSLRDDGRPFDPTAASAQRPGGYGLLLATGLGQKLTYKYMFGQNITTVER